MSDQLDPIPRETVEALAAQLRKSRRTTVLTGAGMSAASGVPTFRGPEGLWRQFRAEELATLEAFERDPRLVWEWYDWRRGLIAACEPNAGHRTLAAWSTKLPGFTLVTQNVDGLHELAGTVNLLRLHGSIWRVRCANECPAGSSREDRRTPLPELPPRCPCGGLLRPDVVWFGEALDPEVFDRATAAAACDTFLTIGTSSIVHPAAGLVHLAREHGAFTAEINPEATDASDVVEVCLRAPAEEALVALDRMLA